MFLELLLPIAELRPLLEGALPLTIHLDATEPAHTLTLLELAEVTLVPDLGARLVCKARLHWPVLGIDAPLTLNSLRVRLVPEVVPSPEGEKLRFRLALEHVDISGVPSAFDDTIARNVNERLAENHVELAWDFVKTFANVVPLPDALDELEALTLDAAWGKVRITDEALVFAVSMRTALVRRGDTPRVMAPNAPNAPPVTHANGRTVTPVERDTSLERAPLSLGTAAVLGVAAGVVAFFGLRSVVSRW